MLRSVLLDGFRSFQSPTTLPFAPLTILAGPDNVGKSSVIGALLAFLQSEQAQSGDALQLSGSWCELGGFDQVLCASLPADRRRFSIGLTGENLAGESVDTLWSFGPPTDQALASAPILNIDYNVAASWGHVSRDSSDSFLWTEETANKQEHSERSGPVSFTHPGSATGQHTRTFAAEDPGSFVYTAGYALSLAPLAAARTHYISAFRAPPQALYAPRNSVGGPPLGRYGEHTAELLFRNRTQRTDILVPGAPSDDAPRPVLPAVNAWWSHIFDDSLALQIDAPARLGFTLAIDTPSAERLGLGQVGLGLSSSSSRTRAAPWFRRSSWIHVAARSAGLRDSSTKQRPISRSFCADASHSVESRFRGRDGPPSRSRTCGRWSGRRAAPPPSRSAQGSSRPVSARHRRRTFHPVGEPQSQRSGH